eukprot:CAMPEP_0119362118 /NCGR_PEP_ID=MMETSP1334-20130426/9272_1 /TAXON_ID=127549 /ORGANISM="Calcidiscus leptoporus, Strain RCC1130" /LENGTH=101 /DNA_ID=CAMNT_0007377285 /DNA_START=185 /DNA_END=488 /DNA_ORIENTATION=+
MALAFRRLGLSSRSVVMYRRALALLLVLDTLDRMRTLRFLYSDEGSLPRWAVLPPLAEAPLLVLCVSMGGPVGSAGSEPSRPCSSLAHLASASASRRARAA